LLCTLQGSLFLCGYLSPRYWQAMICRAFPATLLLLLASCGPSDNDPGPGGVTNADAKALDEAAQKLDERDQKVEAEAKK
jgi:hypothetical protein